MRKLVLYSTYRGSAKMIQLTGIPESLIHGQSQRQAARSGTALEKTQLTPEASSAEVSGRWKTCRDSCRGFQPHRSLELRHKDHCSQSYSRLAKMTPSGNSIAWLLRPYGTKCCSLSRPYRPESHVFALGPGSMAISSPRGRARRGCPVQSVVLLCMAGSAVQ